MNKPRLSSGWGIAVLFVLLCLLSLTLAGGREASASGISRQMAGAPAPAGYLTEPAEGDPLAIALAYIEANQALWGLQDDDLAGLQLIDRYTSGHNGLTHLYLGQHYRGIEVYGANIAIHVAADGRIVAANNMLISKLTERINTTIPGLTPAAAVTSAGRALGLEPSKTLAPVEGSLASEEGLRLNDGGISRQPIPVKLVYQPLEGGSLRLAWDMSIYELDGQDWWSMRVDAGDGRVLDQFNYVLHDEFGPPAAGLLAAGPASQGLQPSLDSISSGPTYHVFAAPAESPSHGSRSLVSDPADILASPFGWHDTNGVIGPEYLITRGNNVKAYEDGNNPLFSPDGTATLLFDFPLDLNLQPDDYEPAAITNLFYWNNLVHDIFYRYGFDEAAGNFQENNYGNGGRDGDGVFAEAQDGAGYNNANFATPPDGGNPTMQMYLWSHTVPMRDGDLDNGIVVHEYGHGISTRLAGGPNNVACLDNVEQPGEGWSDYFALMLTMEPGDQGTDRRGVGTYVLGQLPDGAGIRAYPYSTSLQIDPRTYNDIKDASIPHGVGSVWAAMLWDLTWALIDVNGFDPNLYTGNGGNNLALQLVVDGLKLLPCAPGFVDARDAILQADLVNNGGANQCLIWEAFAKRGLGYSASQGSSASRSDGVEAFDVPLACVSTLKISKSASPSPVDAGGVLTYELQVRNDTPGVLTGVTVTDAVPADSTYVDGSATCNGNEAGGVVTFSLGSMVSGQTATCIFQVTVSDSLFSSLFFEDDMENDGGSWQATPGAGSYNWSLDTVESHSPTHSWFAVDPASISDQYLTLSNPVILSGEPVLRFWHYYRTESTYDGGVVELSANGGPWLDLGSRMLQNGYNGTLAAITGNPIGGRAAFSGDSGGFIETAADLSEFAGNSVQIRFRLGSDNSASSLGWYVDDVQIINEAALLNTACVTAAEGDNACDTISTPVHGGGGQPQVVDQTAGGETSIKSTISGSYLDTLADDGQVETVTERQSGGKPANRYSQLEHKWTFDIVPGDAVTFMANAWAPAADDGDRFVFAYSIDDVTYTDLFTVTETINADNYQSASLPLGVSGAVTIRLTDSDRTAGNSVEDSVYIDQMIIRSETFGGGSLPAAPDNLTAQVIGGGRIDLAWNDNAGDEFGFHIERSIDQQSWTRIKSVGANITAYADTGLADNTTYTYRVQAYNAAGGSAYSNTAWATTPDASAIHVGDLDDLSVFDALKHNRWWFARVGITVHDDFHSPVVGATVSGHWSDGTTGTVSCVTDGAGWCMVEKARLKGGDPTMVTFNMDDITIAGGGASYEPIDNHDPDGDSDGTTIIAIPTL